jgi:hypothetical protein
MLFWDINAHGVYRVGWTGVVGSPLLSFILFTAQLEIAFS